VVVFSSAVFFLPHRYLDFPCVESQLRFYIEISAVVFISAVFFLPHRNIEIRLWRVSFALYRNKCGCF
jgi:hypothetical protein